MAKADMADLLIVLGFVDNKVVNTNPVLRRLVQNWYDIGLVGTARARWPGTLGDPTEANAEHGKDYIEDVADWYIEQIRKSRDGS